MLYITIMIVIVGLAMHIFCPIFLQSTIQKSKYIDGW